MLKELSEGVEQGIEKGIEQTCIKLIKKQYHQDCQEWVESLTGKQLEEIIELIFKEADFKVFKQKIDMIK